ncbi:MAG: YlmH/Sll1252 family protein [Acutalibacteraceae bacterium]|nr:YlmH/Sll1252 family protein [Acutalibacteraceae bacterium]
MTLQVVTIVNNKNLSLSVLSQEDKLLVARVNDCVRFASLKHCAKFIGFLDERAQNIACSISTGGHCAVYKYAGYDNGQRVIFGFVPNDMPCNEEDFEITALTFISRKTANLTHRDYLGALMNLGIQREAVGDILCEQGRGVVFLKKSVCELVKTSVDKIGKEGVKCTEQITYPLPVADNFKKIENVIVSARLDCVVASLCNLSRTKACELINAGSVSINGFECLKITKTVENEDKITVRKYGKFVIDSADKLTRKNKLVLQARKYI